MFQNSKEIFSILGFKIRIDLSWFIIAALIVWSLSNSYFPARLENVSTYDVLSLSVISMLGLFLSLVLHEISHALVARLFNLKVGSITLFIFGGVAELERNPENAKSEFWIAIAGPVMSIFLAGFFYVLKTISVLLDASVMTVELFSYLSLINFVLAVFNLVPAFPLDGGRILRSIIWHFQDNVITATRIATSFGKVFAVILIIMGVLLLFSSQVVAGLWQILIGSFIFGASAAAYEDLKIRHALKDHTVSALMTRHPWVASPEETVQVLIDSVILKHNVSFVPVLENDYVLGYVDASMIKTIDPENWGDTKLGDIYIKLKPENSSRAEVPIQQVFDKMVRSGNRKLLIVKNGMLEGILTLSDLMTYLSIRQELGIYYDKKDKAPLKKSINA